MHFGTWNVKIGNQCDKFFSEKWRLFECLRTSRKEITYGLGRPPRRTKGKGKTVSFQGTYPSVDEMSMCMAYMVFWCDIWAHMAEMWAQELPVSYSKSNDLMHDLLSFTIEQRLSREGQGICNGASFTLVHTQYVFSVFFYALLTYHTCLCSKYCHAQHFITRLPLKIWMNVWKIRELCTIKVSRQIDMACKNQFHAVCKAAWK